MFYIYEIKNLINNKTYIGQRMCPKDKTPETDIKYMGSGELIKKAIKKYGLGNFSKTILISEIKTKKEADKLEIKTIARYKELGKAEYNISIGGTGGNLGDEVNKKISQSNKISMNKPEVKAKFIGHKATEETKIKLSISHKEAMNRPEVIEKCKKSHMGKIISIETRKKLSESMKKIIHTDEWNKKVSESKKGKTTWNKGGHLSDEWKNKLSESKKGDNNVNYNKHWYTDGINNVLEFECPENYYPGRTIKNK